MDPPLPFGPNHRDVLDRATYVTMWQHANYTTRYNRVKKGHHCPVPRGGDPRTTSSSRHNAHSSVKGKSEGSLCCSSDIQQWPCRPPETQGQRLCRAQWRVRRSWAQTSNGRDLPSHAGTKIISEQLTLTTGFDADTAEYNQMNTDLVTSKCEYKRQGKLAKARIRATALLFDKAEIARGWL